MSLNNKDIRFQFVGKFEVPSDNITLAYDYEGGSVEKFREFVAAMISLEHANYHHNSITSEGLPVSTEFRQGMDAFYEGRSKHYNPYRNHSVESAQEYSDWNDGWMFAAHSHAMSKNDTAKVYDLLCRAIDHLRAIGHSDQAPCDIDDSGFCQRHKEYREGNENRCVYMSIADFINEAQSVFEKRSH